MPASSLSPSCPVGLQRLSQFLLDPWLRALTWFIDALCDFNKLRQGGWQRKLLVVAFASRPVGGHICLCSTFSFNLQRLCLWRKMGFLAQTDSRTKVAPHSSPLCFYRSRVSIRVCLCRSCVRFYTRRSPLTIWVTELNCKHGASISSIFVCANEQKPCEKQIK